MNLKQKIETICTPKAFLVLVMACYLFFGLSHLGKFMTADEGRWTYERIPQYWEAISTGDLQRTFINDKPGVSLALLNGFSTLRYPDSETLCVQGKDKIIACESSEAESLYRDFRLPILLVNGLILILLFFLLARLTNQWIAVWSVSLMALSPPLLGISQIINPDALLWSFGTVSLVAFLLVLTYHERKHIFLSAFFLGLALLSKYVALILVPFYAFLIVAKFLLFLPEKLPEPRKTLLLELGILVLISTGALVIFLFFFPALIVHTAFLKDYFKELVTNTEEKGVYIFLVCLPVFIFFADLFIAKSKGLLFIREWCQKYIRSFALIPALLGLTIVVVVLMRYVFPDWNIFTALDFDMKVLTDSKNFMGRFLSFHEALVLNFSPLCFSLTPVCLLGLFFLVLESKEKKLSDYYFFIFTVPLFIFLYIGILIFTDVFATIRYSIILYPLSALLSAFGFWYFAKHSSSFWMTKICITFFILGASLWSLFGIKPFYFNYTNIFLPKETVMVDAWGYGGYEAAQYLNSLPNAENLTVWADYYGFCEFFKGHCLTAYNFDKTLIQPDYYVLTRRGRIRYQARASKLERASGLTAYKYYENANPVWELLIDGRPQNYIKVFKVEK